MSWDRTYTLDVILGDPAASALWNWTQWKQAVSLIDPILSATRGRPGVSSTQFNGKNHVRFGTLGWNYKSHQKWTHNSPLSCLAAESAKWNFLSTEVWAPSRGNCGRDNCPPDFFFYFSNEGFWTTEDGSALQFNPVVIIAIAEALPAEVLEQEVTMTCKISRMLNAKLHAYKSRKWGFKSGSGFMNPIADIAVTKGLFKPGPIHNWDLSLDVFDKEMFDDDPDEWRLRE